MTFKEWVKKNKHLFLWIILIYCAYLLYQKHQNNDVSQIEWLPLIGGAAYGLNFLTMLANNPNNK
ncbi:MAG: hypothetical protein LBR43_00790 [Spiroplasmataceae bacterium]|jgi:hypothetical protein|nr:hypothetical protein [Spiroplasmataceae bacterium]